MIKKSISLGLVSERGIIGGQRLIAHALPPDDDRVKGHHDSRHVETGDLTLLEAKYHVNV